MTPAARWLWVLGTVVLVFAARCREISLHAGDVPVLDQWRAEAQDILVPWLQGRLGPADFLQPHHEHFPVWTRLLAWLEAVVIGAWDAPLQCTLNAALFAGAAAIWTDWVRRTLPFAGAVGLSLLALALAIPPHGWENSTWGFQSMVPLALAFALWHVCGSLAAATGSRAWWGAQVAGGAVLFTFGSMWVVPAAVALTAGWTSASHRRRWLAPSLLAAAGIGLLLFARAHQEHGGAHELAATSLPQFLDAFLVQLGWPSRWPAAALVLHLPALLLALRLRGDPAAAGVDRAALALALCGLGQAAALAYGRGGAGAEFVSRYGDLLGLGVLGNGCALYRLLAVRRPGRPILAAAALVWLAALVQGLGAISTGGHTAYFHEHAAAWNRARRDAVRDYLVTGNRAGLESELVRAKLYPDPAAVAAMLDVPGLSLLLPAGVRRESGVSRGDRAAAAARRLRDWWPALAGAGILLLAGGGWLTRRHPAVSAPPGLDRADDRAAGWCVAGLAAVAAGLLFLWPQPLEFRAEQRRQRLLRPPGREMILDFSIITPTTRTEHDFRGRVPLQPEWLRRDFFGTFLDGDSFTGIAESSPFPLVSPWLVIPVVGFPTSSGHGLRLQVETPDGAPLAEIGCTLPNPADVDFWGVDLRAFPGQNVRFRFYDGRDGAQGWFGAGEPQPAGDEGAAGRLRRRWLLERAEGAHRELAIIAVLLAGLAAGFFLSDRRRAPG